jgi:hypothetical protein
MMPGIPPEPAGQAAAMVAAVSDDPQGRYRMREAFYSRYGFGTGAGYGTSELAFLKWEIGRGVLNPMNGPQPGSPWWRGVNGDFLFLSEAAALIHEGCGSTAGLPSPVEFWLSYFAAPGPQNWYRAHNASIVQGYLNRIGQARLELVPEQRFMGEVLYRLLYAQAMVEDSTILGLIGALLSNPKSDAVYDMVHIPDFYPDQYPLTGQDIRDVLHKGHSPEEIAVDLLDKCLVLPTIVPLFHHASNWLLQPALTSFADHRSCIYPNCKASATAG